MAVRLEFTQNPVSTPVRSCRGSSASKPQRSLAQPAGMATASTAFGRSLPRLSHHASLFALLPSQLQGIGRRNILWHLMNRVKRVLEAGPGEENGRSYVS